MCFIISTGFTFAQSFHVTSLKGGTHFFQALFLFNTVSYCNHSMLLPSYQEQFCPVNHTYDQSGFRYRYLVSKWKKTYRDHCIHMQKADGYFGNIRIDMTNYQNCSEKRFQSLENIKWYQKRLDVFFKESITGYNQNKRHHIIFFAQRNDTFLWLLLGTIYNDLEFPFWSLLSGSAISFLFLLLTCEKIQCKFNSSLEEDDDIESVEEYLIQDYNNNILYDDSSDEEQIDYI